jgi:hypothetical protein
MPIFDQGYQHWKGPLSPHRWRWLAIARHGVRVQLKNRNVRRLLIVACAPALALVTAAVLWGLVEQKSQSVLAVARNLLPADVVGEPRAYRLAAWTIGYSLFFKLQTFFIMLLAAVAGPGLISQDLRFNALPLYFSRPLTRRDYFLGKLGVIGALVAAVAVAPAVFAYLVGACFSLDLTVVRDTYAVLLAGMAFGLLATLSVGTLILALSSLSRRSLYVGIAWAGLWIISWVTGTALTEMHQEGLRDAVTEAELAPWLEKHPPPPGVQMRGPYPAFRPRPRGGKRGPGDIVPRSEDTRWYEAWSREYSRARGKGQARQAEAARRDWRPLCSYTTNLDRMGDWLLRTDAAWVEIGRAVERSRLAVEQMGPLGVLGIGPRPEPANDRLLADQMVMQFPWQWSAGVLAGLVGLSTWTLTRRVKSLDRLK